MTAQDLNLSLDAERPFSNGLKDSLKLNNSFKNYLQLKQGADSISLKLQRLGFMESKLLEIIKKNYIREDNVRKILELWLKF